MFNHGLQRKTDLQWINRYLDFHHRRHPAKLGPQSITPFLFISKLREILLARNG